ncbi:hypothetical protein M0R19_01730 [Candidatus Pacearchaeota archaeon]|jgi:hypothetical protein|nr:hypothetical protein [Candidatus Pacearchaeota archaeon]
MGKWFKNRIRTNLRPNIIKVIASILFAPLASFISLINYGIFHCLHAICPASIMRPLPKCKGSEIFLCCHTCIPNSIQKLEMILLWISVSIIFFILFYVSYSFIKRRK